MKWVVAALAAAPLAGCYKFSGGTVFDLTAKTYFAFEEDVSANASLAFCPDGYEKEAMPSAKPRRANGLLVVNSSMTPPSTDGRSLGWRKYQRAIFFECKEHEKDTQ